MNHQRLHRRSTKHELLPILIALLFLATTNVVNGFDLHHHGHVLKSRFSSRRISDKVTTREQRQRNKSRSLSLSHLENKLSELLSSSSQSIGQTDEDDKDAANSNSLTVRGGGESSEGNLSLVPPRRRQIVPIMVALIIGSFSVLEIVESLREEADAMFGHAHGIFLLSLIRLFRSIAILQTEAEEFGEAVEKMMEVEGEDHTGNMKGSWQRSLAKFVVSRKVSIVACVMASIASVIEIVDDIKPGGHHGAVFLALSELNYQINRFSHVTDHAKKKGNDNDNDNKEVANKKKIRRVTSVLVGPACFVAAACFAAFEIYEDMRPGAHHAVAVLALAELVENVNRSKLMNRRRRRFFIFGPTVAPHATS